MFLKNPDQKKCIVEFTLNSGSDFQMHLNIHVDFEKGLTKLIYLTPGYPAGRIFFIFPHFVIAFPTH